MLGEFKRNQLFVEKIKLINNLYVENPNHLSWNKSRTNCVQQVSKITKESYFKFKLFVDVRGILKWSIVCWKNQTCKQLICRKLDLKR